MNVEEGLKRVISRDGAAHLTLIDPEKQSPKEAGEIAYDAAEAGTYGIMVGGSTGVDPRITDGTILEIQRATKLPTILFPAGAACLSPHADALFFMSLLNSRDRRFLIDEQRRGAPYVKKFGIEAIPMGYIVFEPGMRVGEVGRADLVGRTDIQRAVEYALAAELFGMACVYLESGSGAPKPLPGATIKAVRRVLSIPVIVGGGITTPDAARKVVEAGADIIVTGTVAEREGEAVLADIISAVRKASGASGK